MPPRPMNTETRGFGIQASWRTGNTCRRRPTNMAPICSTRLLSILPGGTSSNRSFFYYTSVLTHGPHVETPDPEKPEQRRPAGFQSNLEYLDFILGQLRTGLAAEGLADNTYLFLIGDNGTAGDGKGTVTELGARVPGIFVGPGIRQIGRAHV